MPRKSYRDIQIARECRKQTRLERLKTNEPRCVICGETDDRCMEDHHLAGRKNDPFTVNTCRNCHRKLSDDQRDHPKQQKPPKDHLEAIGHFLLGLAELLAQLMEKLRDFGHELIDRARSTASQAVQP